MLHIALSQKKNTNPNDGLKFAVVLTKWEKTSMGINIFARQYILLLVWAEVQNFLKYVSFSFSSIIIPTRTSFWWTAKYEGECTSGCNHRVSSESTWVAELLGCMRLMTTGREAEKTQWDEEERNVTTGATVWWSQCAHYWRGSRTEQGAVWGS